MHVYVHVHALTQKGIENSVFRCMKISFIPNFTLSPLFLLMIVRVHLENCFIFYLVFMSLINDHYFYNCECTLLMVLVSFSVKISISYCF